MNCKERLRLLDEYLAGTMSAGTSAEMEAHLTECPTCRSVFADIRQAIALCQTDETYELPVAFHDRLHRALRRKWVEIHLPDAPPKSFK